MKTIISIFLFICSSFFLFAQDTTYFADNFDNYPAAELITDHSNEWIPWSGPNAPASQIAIISDQQAKSQPNSLHFVNDNDIIYDFEDKMRGRHRISFDILVEENQGAHINVQHEFTKNWAFTLIFRQDETIKFMNGDDELILSPYTANIWHKVEMDINIDSDSLHLYLDENILGHFAFRRSQSGSLSTSLDCINFFGQNGNQEESISSSSFFIDDFKYEGIIYSPPQLDISNEAIISTGDISYISVANSGELPLNYRIYPVYESHPNFNGDFQSKVITYNLAEAPDQSIIGWQADKLMKYIVRFYPEDLTGTAGLQIDSVLTYSGEYLDQKATLFLLDKGGAKDKFQMGEVLFEIDFENLPWNSKLLLPVDVPFTLTGQEFSMGMEAICPGLYNNMIPFENIELAAETQYRNFYYNDGEYFDMPNPIFFKVYASGNAWPEWIYINTPKGSLAPGESYDFEIFYNAENLQVNSTYHASIYFASDDPNHEFTEIPVTLDITSNTQNEGRIEILMFPNPVRQELNIQSDTDIHELSLFSENGILLSVSKDLNRHFRIDLSQFEGNSFILQFKTSDQLISKKIFKIDK